VLFIGAGASYGAGNPLWGTLISDIAKEAHMTVAERASLKKIGFLDASRILTRRLEGYNKSLGKMVALQLDAQYTTLIHTLLSFISVCVCLCVFVCVYMCVCVCV